MTIRSGANNVSSAPDETMPGHKIRRSLRCLPVRVRQQLSLLTLFVSQHTIRGDPEKVKYHALSRLIPGESLPGSGRERGHLRQF